MNHPLFILRSGRTGAIVGIYQAGTANRASFRIAYRAAREDRKSLLGNAPVDHLAYVIEITCTRDYRA